MTCVVPKCGNRARGKLPGLSFHRFPKDKIFCQKWLDALKIPNFEPKTCHYVCSKHFKREDLCIFGSKTLLLEGAIPLPKFCVEIVTPTEWLEEKYYIYVPDESMQPTSIHEETESLVSTIDEIQEPDPLSSSSSILENKADGNTKIQNTQGSSESASSHLNVELPAAVMEIHKPYENKVDGNTEAHNAKGSSDSAFPDVKISDAVMEKHQPIENVSIKIAMESSDDELASDPKHRKTRAKLKKLRECVISQREKIKRLNQTVRRRNSTLSEMKQLVKQLEDRITIVEEINKTLSTVPGPNRTVSNGTPQRIKLNLNIKKITDDNYTYTLNRSE